MTHTTDLYFEAHVTTDPVPDDQTDLLARIARDHSFRVAALYMKKGTGLRSRLDDFMTTRCTNYEAILGRCHGVVAALTNAGIPVRRWKIENTLLDVHLKPETA